jgi:hypothetical protein
MGVLARKLLVSDAAAPSSLEIAASATWNTNITATTSFSVTLPSGIASGDLLLMFIGVDGSTKGLTHTGWTELGYSTADSEQRYILGRIADGSEGATASFTNSVSESAGANTYRITGNRNGLTTSEIAVSSVVDYTNTTTTADPPSLTPSWGSAENLWFAVVITNDSAITSIVSYPTNYALGQLTNIVGSGGGGSAREAIMSAARLLTASSEDPGVFTWTTARRAGVYTIAVRPA